MYNKYKAKKNNQTKTRQNTKLFIIFYFIYAKTNSWNWSLLRLFGFGGVRDCVLIIFFSPTNLKLNSFILLKLLYEMHLSAKENNDIESFSMESS